MLSDNAVDVVVLILIHITTTLARGHRTGKNNSGVEEQMVYYVGTIFWGTARHTLKRLGGNMAKTNVMATTTFAEPNSSGS